MFAKLRELFSRRHVLSAHTLPLVEFDKSKITKTVEADLKESIRLVVEFTTLHQKTLYKPALESIALGRDLASLNKAILDLRINSIDKKRSAEICRFIHNRATALMTKEHQEAIGINLAKWVNSGAPCLSASHEQVNGKTYEVQKGMFVDGKFTWPGRKLGCKCLSKSIISEFS